MNAQVASTDLSHLFETRPHQFDACAGVLFGGERKEILTPVAEWRDGELNIFNYLQRFIGVAHNDTVYPAAVESIRRDAVCAFFGGIPEVGIDAGTHDTRYAMGGVLHYSLAGGCGHLKGVTEASLQMAFEQLLSSSAKEGERRFVFGTHATLLALYNIYREAMWNTYTDMEIHGTIRDFQSLLIGGTNSLLIPCDYLSTHAGILPSEWHHRIAVLDLDNIELCEMKGVPFFAEYQTDDRFACEMNFTIRVPKPMNNFFIDLAPNKA